MSNEMILTFAEIEFLLRSRQPKLDARRLLRIRHEAAGDVMAAAGLASLLARNLCSVTGGKVKAGKEIAVVATLLATADIEIDALGWVGDDMLLLHVFSCPGGSLSLRPAGPGVFAVDALDPGRPLSDGLVRMVNLCLTGDGESAVLLKMVTTTSESVSVAIARGADGRWNLSDSTSDPQSSQQVTPEVARMRVAELFGGGAVATGATR